MLYISDLDGTLLDNEGKLSEFTVKTVRDFIARGGMFTIASARSIFTAGNFIESLGLKIPVILRNGAFIYEPVTHKVLSRNLMSGQELRPVLDFFLSRGMNPIIHHIDNGEFRVDYTGVFNNGEKHYFDSRTREGDSRLRIISGYDKAVYDECISVCIIDEDKRIEMVLDEFINGPGREFMVHRYIDNYSLHVWLEVNHSSATKAKAAKKLLKITGESEYIAFGDNINDLDMLEGAASAFMPLDSYLSSAGYDFCEIDTNDSDGVAKFLATQSVI